MPSRKELELRARVLGIDPASYVNDSKLEQRVIYEEYNAATATGTLQTGTLTSDATAPSDTETVTVAPKTYTYKTTLTEVAASQTLTGDNTGNATAGTQVVIGPWTYTFRSTLAKPFDVLIGASADATLTNLVSAITGAGTVGTDYATGTTTNTDVTATGPSSHVVTVTALKVGTFANGITVYTNEATYTWGGTTLAGGVEPVANEVLIGASAAVALDNIKSAINGTTGAGTTYSSGTVAHPLVTATTNTDTTQVVQAVTQSNNESIATTETSAHLSWGAATLGSGVAVVKAKTTYVTTGATGGAAV